MIVKPTEMNFANQHFSMIIYGSPGTGKTTMALSAPKPLLIDFDGGISRVRAEHRKDTSICNTYEEVLKDVNSPELDNYETVVIDTGGAFVTYLKDWAMRTRPGCRTKDGNFHPLKGFGEVKTEFTRFTEYLTKIRKKNVIYVFHSVESTDNDGTVQRLMCEGAAKNTVWTPCDFGGYVQMIGNQRVICFTPEQEFFAKGTHGIVGKIPVPELTEGVANDFVTKLFEKAKDNIKAEAEALAPLKAKYDEVMTKAKNAIDSIKTVEDANKAAAEIPTWEHALTSKREASVMLNEKATSLGFEWDKSIGAYKAKDTKDDKKEKPKEAK